MDAGLLKALQNLEKVLQEEAHSTMNEELAARKDAAIASVQAFVLAGMTMGAKDAEAMALHLQALLIANRFSLKWSGLQAQLAQLGQPKVPAPAIRPRLDLVH